MRECSILVFFSRFIETYTLKTYRTISGQTKAKKKKKEMKKKQRNKIETNWN